MKKNMIWCVRVWLSSLELWQNIWQRCEAYYFAEFDSIFFFFFFVFCFSCNKLVFETLTLNIKKNVY
jgi:hypothetical protein